MRLSRVGVTMVELVIVIMLVGLLAVVVPLLILPSVRAFVLIPTSQATNQVAMEILAAMIEGSHSTLQLKPLRGLRYAAREQMVEGPDPAIWLAEEIRVGYLIPHDPLDPLDNEYVVLRLDGEVIKRALYTSLSCPPPPTAEEVIPYHAADIVRVFAKPPAPGKPPQLFRYFDLGGSDVGVLGCTSDPKIRRIDVTFVAQTGAGEFDQGDARIDVMSGVAIRFP